ncbi:hypothetical protein DL89DRAFT_294886 [Linderina pennispora]|uniref:C3H1-type domain-containing protein n=1 Tax=Linderina pennispora TaxID=61395 RepID=A0A1Y1W0R8_9FUNG|nr:uncharacterized protein DL89DRAFT_294886 [Linderina pennispora]ORX67091.1 hypothetical protein DL89DRAFT_294886 [Linderina pennispora]
MEAPSSTLIVCVSLGVIAIVTLLITGVLLLLRRSQHKSPQDDLEQGTENSSERQPLLNDASIRTRYAQDSNEFARPFIVREGGLSPNAGSTAIGSAMGFSPVENVVTIVPSDSSDSESSADSCSTAPNSGNAAEDAHAGIATKPAETPSVVVDEVAEPMQEAKRDENVSAQDSGSEAVASESVVLPRSTAIGEPRAAPMPVHTRFSFTQLSESEDTDMTTDDDEEKPATRTFADVTAKRLGRREPSQSSGDTAVMSGKAGPQSTAQGPRQRGFTLNAQAKAFRAEQAAAQLGIGQPGDDAISRQLSAPQMQALGRAAANGGREQQQASQPGGRTVDGGSNCKYVHPSQTCRMYPDCSYSNHCIYIHPSDTHKINIMLSRGNSRRSKRSQQDILRLNNLEAYVADN